MKPVGLELLVGWMSVRASGDGLRSKVWADPPGTSSATEQQPPLASLNITFEFGSSALTTDAKMQLRTLGEALNSSALASDVFLIEGHTDSIGSAQYNQSLSERRAMVVKRYLVDYAGVRASRLQAEGRGETKLLDTEAPRSATNRRVQVVNLQVGQ